MVKEERYIKNRFGKDNHFRVPTGYFDNFASTIIDKLPEQEHVIIHRRSRMQILRPILYSAACLILPQKKQGRYGSGGRPADPSPVGRPDFFVHHGPCVFSDLCRGGLAEGLF